jgi:hypothetical protein
VAIFTNYTPDSYKKCFKRAAVAKIDHPTLK